MGGWGRGGGAACRTMGLAYTGTAGLIFSCTSCSYLSTFLARAADTLALVGRLGTSRARDTFDLRLPKRMRRSCGTTSACSSGVRPARVAMLSMSVYFLGSMGIPSRSFSRPSTSLRATDCIFTINSSLGSGSGLNDTGSVLRCCVPTSTHVHMLMVRRARKKKRNPMQPCGGRGVGGCAHLHEELVLLVVDVPPEARARVRGRPRVSSRAQERWSRGAYTRQGGFCEGYIVHAASGVCVSRAGWA